MGGGAVREYFLLSVHMLQLFSNITRTHVYTVVIGERRLWLDAAATLI